MGLLDLFTGGMQKDGRCGFKADGCGRRRGEYVEWLLKYMLRTSRRKF
jgi:hypothetical protein